MTAIFMARTPDSIIAAADGAFYHGDGILSGIASKLILLPEQDAVITLQGPYFFHGVIRSLLPCDRGFDGLLGRIVDVAPLAYHAPGNDPGHSRKFSMLIGGFSERRQAWESYWLLSEAELDTVDEVREAWTLIPATPTTWKPHYGRSACIAAGMDPDRCPVEAGLTAEEFAVRVICAGRASPLSYQDGDGPALCQVGGFVQVARLARSWACTEIVHRWPDALGEKLDAANGPLTPFAPVDHP